MPINPDKYSLLEGIYASPEDSKYANTMSSPSTWGSGLESGSIAPQNTQIADSPNQSMGRGAISAMNAGGGIGQVATSAGIAGLMSGATAGPYALAGGLAISAIENANKAKAMKEQATIQEAIARKEAVQGALNQALGATRQLGV